MKKLCGENGWDESVEETCKGCLDLAKATNKTPRHQLAPKPEDVKPWMDSKYFTRLSTAKPNERGNFQG